ncbi:hypothetical protein [Streptantibioticus parmotrematis]|uniref:hypothetical protein n=1 Tax=Streptantibioticus parmotrematis TaxID=2873249 RepID=UPI00207BD81B|nr:hypothetical protein [Streptantibioticus parmotrematis]
MAERRTTRQLKARDKARARTVERRQREQRLEDLATTWFEAEDAIADKASAADEKIRKYTEKVRGEVEKENGKLREQMSDVMGEMLVLSGVRSVAERLGVAEAVVREVKASLHGTASAPADSGSPTPKPTSTAVERPGSTEEAAALSG